MIKFFRKIRQKLLTENPPAGAGRAGKFSKYLIYAIGEIVLVVIGILIALWINNENQERFKEEKIESILMAIQDDIVTGDYFSQWLINKYISDDSLYNKVFSNQYDYDRLSKEDLSGIWAVSFNCPTFYVRANGYNQLKENLNEVPAKYSSILQSLTQLHNTEVRTLESQNLRSVEIKFNYLHYLKNNEPWHALDRFSGEISKGQIEYYRSNPNFKSHVYDFHEFEGNMLYEHSRYRNRVMQIYANINEALGDKARELPDRIRVTSTKTEKDADRLTGTYKLTSGPDHTDMGKQIKVTSEGKDLHLLYADLEQPRKLLFYHHEKPWFSMRAERNILRFENNGENTLSIITGRKAQTHWEKVIE